jgi:hypothetical protein
VGGWFSAGHLVLVVSGNKLVKDAEEAETRLNEYAFKLESARVRVAYGIPGSAVVNRVAMKMANPMGSRTTVVIVNTAMGF